MTFVPYDNVVGGIASLNVGSLYYIDVSNSKDYPELNSSLALFVVEQGLEYQFIHLWFCVVSGSNDMFIVRPVPVFLNSEGMIISELADYQGSNSLYIRRVNEDKLNKASLIARITGFER